MQKLNVFFQLQTELKPEQEINFQTKLLILYFWLETLLIKFKI